MPDGYRTVEAPGGLTIAVPTSWPVRAAARSKANLEAPDPAGDCFVRFGGTTAGAGPLTRTVAGFEKDTTTIRPGYRRVRLGPVAYGDADEAVDWEFTFRSDTGPRHAYGRYWRIGDVDYVAYGSCSTSAWPRLGDVLSTMFDTAAPH